MNPQPVRRTNNPTPRTGAKAGWTPERRARQAAAIRRWQPWARSTGPRTEDGKNRAKMNALKHGGRSAEMREICRLLRLHNTLVKCLGEGLKLGLPDAAIMKRWEMTRMREENPRTKYCAAGLRARNLAARRAVRFRQAINRHPREGGDPAQTNARLCRTFPDPRRSSHAARGLGDDAQGKRIPLNPAPSLLTPDLLPIRVIETAVFTDFIEL